MLHSVRFRLLILALLPVVVLLPLVLGLSMARWSARFDTLLIENVESDLGIAEQYLERIITDTGGEVRAIARSSDLRAALDLGPDRIAATLAPERVRLGLDFLTYLEPASPSTWPVVDQARRTGSATAIDIFDAATLAAISPEIVQRAAIPLIPTEAAVPTERTVESRGMMVHTAARVGPEGGVLVGGILLNRNLDFIDTINDLVYRQDGEDDTLRLGTATLFLDDVRVSTNVRLFEDVRALGTRVSAAVRQAVLGEGQTWLDRAFVVNDWYISGYLPITDSFGNRVGMLYVGFLESPFVASTRSTYLTVFGALALILLATVPLFLRLARGIFSPLETMTRTMRQVEGGDLEARIGTVGSRDEIGTVASHLDHLLDEVQARDEALRAWADELNHRVDQRTEELRDANRKLEDTFKQLVMSEKLASIGEITAGLAHEINNPVAVIQGNLDVMRATLGPAADPVRTEMNLIDQQVHRINVMVSKLLQFARPGEFSGNGEATDLGQVVTDCLVLVDHVLSKGHIKVVQTLDMAPEVRIDPGEAQQVVINLLVNAAQAMGNSGELILTVDEQVRDGRTGARLMVEDSGPGIAEERLGTVFDPFYTTKLGQGTGLGLSISQTLVQRAGGVIGVENRARGGARFTVWMPAHSQSAEAAE